MTFSISILRCSFNLLCSKEVETELKVKLKETWGKDAREGGRKKLGQQAIYALCSPCGSLIYSSTSNSCFWVQHLHLNQRSIVHINASNYQIQSGNTATPKILILKSNGIRNMCFFQRNGHDYDSIQCTDQETRVKRIEWTQQWQS